jgi:putative membrane protein
MLMLPQLEAILVLLWVLTMISLPIVNWTLGPAALQNGISAGVLVQVAVVLAILWRSWGAGRVLRISLGVILLAWASEAIGSATDIPFGAYDYTPMLQPQLLGVPLLIPLAWLMMLPTAWAVAQVILRSRSNAGIRRRLALAGVSALAFTAWDLFLDPQMVTWKFWVWQQPGGYFGIPWVNFLGWILVSGVITFLVNPRDLPEEPLLLVYTITWLLETIGQLLFWGLPGPALVGFAGMGGMLLWTWKRRKTNG